jgi:hypothetical protein
METIILILALFLPSITSGEELVYDQNWNLKYWVEDGRAYDKNWQLKGHMQGGKIIDLEFKESCHFMHFLNIP